MEMVFGRAHPRLHWARRKALINIREVERIVVTPIKRQSEKLWESVLKQESVLHVAK